MIGTRAASTNVVPPEGWSFVLRVERSAFVVLCVNDVAPSKGTKILASTRFRSLAQSGDVDATIASVRDLGVSEAARLGAKLRAVDAMSICQTRFSDEVVAGRIIVCSQHAADLPACLVKLSDAVASEFGAVLLTQPDYDQMLISRSHLFESTLALETRHEPSARGTIEAFTRVLDAAGADIRRRWLVHGVGNLGRRMVSTLLTHPQNTVIVRDIDPNRIAELAPHPALSSSHFEFPLFPEVECVVLAAYGGSLSRVAATHIANSRDIVAVGGPEAGLDNDEGAIDILTAAGKHFIPSTVCGAVGLAANLDEMLHGNVRLDEMLLSFAAYIDGVTSRIRTERRLFQEVWRPVHE